MKIPFLYNSFSAFLDAHFPFKVQKISIDAGMTCPNRDGTKGRGGCTYCNNRTFNPAYCQPEKSVASQLEEGKQFFAGKYPDMNYLAYFQAYTNTYADLEKLKQLYEEALSVDRVVGLVIATRPDCVSEDILDYLAELNKKTFLLVEYGIESVYDDTLVRINRGHTFEETASAVSRTARRGILVGGHIIFGLPGEVPEDMADEAALLSRLPLNTLKIHQLQLIKGTRMAQDYEQDSSQFALLDSVEAYVDLIVDFLEQLRPDMVVERFVSQSPAELLIAPKWGLKNHEVTALVMKRMQERNTYQGKYYEEPHQIRIK